MFELKVENHKGEVLRFPESEEYTIYKITGLNPPAVKINTTSNATTDGMSVNSKRVDKRNIVIYAYINGDVEANRIGLYKYFPLKQTVKIYFANGTRDVYIEGEVETIEIDPFTQRQKAQISILCPQPYFLAVDELTTSFSAISALFQFPFSIPESGAEISAITTDIRKTILNNGDVASGIIIRIYAIGEVVNPVIYDVFKRTHMRIAFTMQTNDEIVINTHAGKKRITLLREGVEYNIMGNMVADSSWLVLEPGDNVFTYDAESGVNNIQLRFITSELFGGV